MTRYGGLCIGGPLAGVNAVNDRPRLMAPVSLDILATSFDDNRRTNVEIVEYHHSQVGFQDGTKTGFWIPAEHDQKWAMRQLFDTYSGVHA